MTEFRTPDQISPRSAQNPRHVMLYIGTRYADLVQSDAERFCPGTQIIRFDEIETAWTILATTRFKAIVLDDGALEREISAFLNTLRSAEGLNSETPVRILALKECAWGAQLVDAYDNVLMIPDDTGSPRDPFRANS